jgi:hypothetical protein
MHPQFSSPEAEVAALRAENARLRRLLDLTAERARQPAATQRHVITRCITHQARRHLQGAATDRSPGDDDPLLHVRRPGPGGTAWR